MTYSIGEFSKQTGIGIHALRYYEKEQLIQPERTINGRRSYSDHDITWLQFIKRLKDTGMPIKEIREYARLRAIGDTTMEKRLNMLIQHKSELEIELKALTDHLEKLDDKINYYKAAIKKLP